MQSKYALIGCKLWLSYMFDHSSHDKQNADIVHIWTNASKQAVSNNKNNLTRGRLHMNPTFWVIANLTIRKC